MGRGAPVIFLCSRLFAAASFCPVLCYQQIYKKRKKGHQDTYCFNIIKILMSYYHYYYIKSKRFGLFPGDFKVLFWYLTFKVETTDSGCVYFSCLCQVEVWLQQHPGGPHQALQSHVVLVQHQTAQRDPEGLQDRLQNQTAEPEQAEPRHRATCPGESCSVTINNKTGSGQHEDQTQVFTYTEIILVIWCNNVQNKNGQKITTTNAHGIFQISYFI